MKPQIFYNPEKCACKVLSSSYSTKNECADSPESNLYDWSRLGPMGALLEPKLFAVNSESSPRSGEHAEFRKHGETNNFLKNLQKKYLEKLQKQPAHDALRRINEDRLKTTYQYDFGHDVEYSCIEYDDLDFPIDFLPEKKESEVFIPCRKPLRPPYIGGHDVPGLRIDKSGFDDLGDSLLDSVESGTNSGSGGKNSGGGVKGRSSGGKTGGKVNGKTGGKTSKGPLTNKSRDSGGKGSNSNKGKPTLTSTPTKSQKIPSNDGSPMDIQAMQILDDEPWISEYQDVIDRTAEEIIRSQLHNRKKSKNQRKHGT